MMNQKAAYEKWLERVNDAELKRQLAAMDESEKADAFYRHLEFGTGGLRGVIGAGTNRMNIYTVGRATQGLCDYLNGKSKFPSVAVAYDSRNKSMEFAQLAASVFAANGIRALLFSELMPTPVLSFAVRELNCTAGIVITASHNPAKYNGYKVYGSDGCQITLDAAEAIQNRIEAVDEFETVKTVPFESGLASGTIEPISDELLLKFLDCVESSSIHPDAIKRSGLNVIYTPLNGTGNKPVRAILARAGIADLTVVPSQENPDGNFPTCPKPNPEERAAFGEALKLAQQIAPDLLLATDPDCDRIGIAVQNGDDYTLLTGNETGCLLLHYILSQRKATGSLPRHPIVVKTIVTTAMAYAIAKEYDAQIIDTLTGFKFIGEQIGLLQQQHRESDYVFGFEESYGYLPGTFVRDKDAVSAALLICEMAAFYKEQGRSLLDELSNLYQKYGHWKHKLLTYAFEGIGGMEKMSAMMAKFRSASSEFAGLPVFKTDDYKNSVSVNRGAGIKTPLSLPKSDVLVFTLDKSCEIVVRPSGTEPKLKCYLTARAQDGESAEKLLTAIEADLSIKLS